MDLQRANALEREANEHNSGRCTHCEQTIKVYRYGISESMVAVLRAMAKATTPNTGRAVDVDTIELRHSERTQLTKLRFHGLVAKVKNEDNTQVARHWLITRKGWQFLGNEDVPAKVVVYNNQVLGHSGGLTSIKRIAGGNGEYEQAPITEAESRTLAHVRTPVYDKTVKAAYTGMSVGALVNCKQYAVRMERLQMGKPLTIEVQLEEPKQITYNDIAAFSKAWRVEG